MSMTSLDFLNNVVNPARVGAGENPVVHKDFFNRITSELDHEEIFPMEKPSTGGRVTRYYDLTEDQMRLVGMRESKAVRRAVLAELNRLYAKAKEAPKSLEQMLRDAADKIAAQSITIGKLTGQMATVTDLASEYSIVTGERHTAESLNSMLCNKGLQTRTRRHKLNAYHPTSKADGYCKIVTGNTLRTALHWDLAVIDILLEDNV